MHAEQGFEPDMLRLLSGHGWLGPGTIAPPTGALRENLTSFKDTGGPPCGAGAATALGPLLLAESQQDRWEVGLPPDIKRAAPEIFRSMRSSGCLSVRDWLTQNFTGSRKATVWTDLWNVATNIDYAVGRVSTASELAILVATDDAIEIGMRRLSAHVYESRTGDSTGASAMLAVRAPGLDIDVAPSWLVDEVTKHSKSEYDRAQRMRGGGGGRGRGDKGDPKGGGRGSGGDGGDSGPGPPRGRGRGGRGK